MQLLTISSGHACHGHGQHGRAKHCYFASFRDHVDLFRTCSASVLCMHRVPCGQHVILEERTNATLNTSCFVQGFLMNFRSHASGLYICLRAMRSVHVPPKLFAQAAFLLADTFIKIICFAV